MEYLFSILNKRYIAGIVIGTLLFSALSFSSAQSGNSPFGLESNVNITRKFLVQSEDYKSIVGSPYLTEEYQIGKILLDGYWYDSTLVRFDIFNDYFEVKLSKGVFILDPAHNSADTIIVEDEVFVRKNIPAGKKMKIVYLSLLTNRNGVSLCKKYNVRLDLAKKSDGFTAAEPAKYVSNSSNYFIFKENDVYDFKGITSLVEIFNTDKKTIREYMKIEKYKLSNEEDLVAVINYLSD